MSLLNLNFIKKKAEKRKAKDEPTVSIYLQWKETIDKNLQVIWIENKTLRKKWSFYFIKGMPDRLFPWKNCKPEVWFNQTTTFSEQLKVFK
jgi:hypothetical protein